MIIKVPMTGEIKEFDPEHPELASGNPDNPVRPLDFAKLLPRELLGFAWKAVELNFVNGIMTIEVMFSKKTIVTEWDNTKDPPEPLTWRKESDAEFSQRQANSVKALSDTFEKKTAGELYEITKEPKLKKP